MLDFFNMVLHIDQTLSVWVDQYGAWVYPVLFLIVFAETGLVVLPFLPGDSLLFIAGALGATGKIDPVMLSVLLLIAAVTGNTLNYTIGRYIGPRVFSMNLRFLDRGALMRTHAFYEKHGGKTIVLSRFIPVVRTFAPFVAGGRDAVRALPAVQRRRRAGLGGRSGGGRLLLRQHSVHQGPPEHHRAAGPGRRHRAGGRRGPVR